MAGLNLGPADQPEGVNDDVLTSMMDPTNPVEAAFELSWEQTPVGAISRIMAQRETENLGGPKLGPRELNERFPDLPEKFDEPMTLQTAALIADRHSRRARLQEAIERGPKDPLLGTVTFAASLLPHVIDPINVAASIATGGLAAKFAGIRAANVARNLAAARGLTAAQEAAIAGMGVRALSTAEQFAFGAGEALVGNMAVEPLVFAASAMDKTEYTVADAFMNSIAPAVVFPAVGLAGRRLMRYAGLADPHTASAVHDANIGRMSQGLSVDAGVTALTKQLVKETSGSDFRPYAFRTLDDMRNTVAVFDNAFKPKGAVVADRPWYAASPAPAGDFQKADKALIGHPLGGRALYLSDNPNVANGAAARAGNVAAGQVFEVDLSTARILDLNTPLPEPVVAALRKELGVGLPKDPQELLEKIIAKADDGDEEVFERFQAAIREAGFDGVAYRQDRLFGEAHPPHNVVAVFDETKVMPKAAMKADRAKVPTLSKEELTEIAQRQLDPDARMDDAAFFHDAEGVREVRSFADVAAAADEKAAALKSDTAERLGALAEMEKQELLDADDLKELEEIRRLTKRQEKVPVVSAQALACVKGS